MRVGKRGDKEEFDVQGEEKNTIIIMIRVKGVQPPGSCGKVGEMKEVSVVSTPNDDDVICSEWREDFARAVCFCSNTVKTLEIGQKLFLFIPREGGSLLWRRKSAKAKGGRILVVLCCLEGLERERGGEGERERGREGERRKKERTW